MCSGSRKFRLRLLQILFTLQHVLVFKFWIDCVKNLQMTPFNQNPEIIRHLSTNFVSQSFLKKKKKVKIKKSEIKVKSSNLILTFTLGLTCKFINLQHIDYLYNWFWRSLIQERLWSCFKIWIEVFKKSRAHILTIKWELNFNYGPKIGLKTRLTLSVSFRYIFRKIFSKLICLCNILIRKDQRGLLWFSPYRA